MLLCSTDSVGVAEPSSAAPSLSNSRIAFRPRRPTSPHRLRLALHATMQDLELELEEADVSDEETEAYHRTDRDDGDDDAEDEDEDEVPDDAEVDGATAEDATDDSDDDDAPDAAPEAEEDEALLTPTQRRNRRRTAARKIKQQREARAAEQKERLQDGERKKQPNGGRKKQGAARIPYPLLDQGGV